ncbi:MAG: hypothetical protein WD934_09870 [Gemmatimonadales bacterium]
MRRIGWVAMLGLAACVSGTPRPVPPATEFQVDASPANALAIALDAVTAQGFPLRAHDPVRGVVETNYTDIAQYVQAANQFPPAERTVRFRIVVVPAETGYGSRIAIEARYSPFLGGGADISARRERPIPRDHPAMELVRELERYITERAVGR